MPRPRKPKPRRPRGTGQIRKTPHGRYRAILRRDGVIESSTHATWQDAQDWLTHRAAAAPIGAPRRRATLSEVRDDYLADMERRGVTETTVRTHRQHLDAVLATWGHVRLEQLTSPYVSSILAEMHRLGWGPATVRNRVDRITSIHRLALERGWIHGAPLQKAADSTLRRWHQPVWDAAGIDGRELQRLRH